MIATFKNKGLEALFVKGDPSRVIQSHLKKLKFLLSMLNQAKELRDLAFPGSNLHPLKGKLKGYYSIAVTGNWRLIFRFEDGIIFDLDYLDHH